MWPMQTQQLNNGSFLSGCAIEIVSIPDASISPYADELETRMAYSADIGRSLSSIFDVYKSFYAQTGNRLAIELIWYSDPVQFQTYAAKIRLILLFRAITSNRQDSERIVSHAADTLSIMLEIDRYSFEPMDMPAFQKVLQSVNYETRQSIVRVVRSVKLPIPSMPQCLHYDCFNLTPPALEILVNAMIKSPNTMVSFQLMPTYFSQDEQQSVSSICQTLGMLSSGVRDPAFGFIPVVAAKKCVDTYTYYDSQSDKPLFLFNASVYGSSKRANIVSFAVQSVLSGTGETALMPYPLTDVAPSVITKNYMANPWMLAEHLQGRYPATGLPAFNRLPFIISSEEGAVLFNLPVGGQRISAGFTVDESLKIGKEYRASLIDTGEITIGKLRSSGGTHTLGITKNDIAKHMLIVGTPGSGKTTFSIGLLDSLWKQGVPFLVIEPAKNEYRALVQSIPDLQVFTPGKNMISPFVFNPFVLPDNVRLESYKSTLKTAFAAGVSMTTPLDKIFEETINNCYAEFGWLDTYTSADKGTVFNISDFIKCFESTFERIGYTGEVSNIGKAGVVRLKGLTNLFDNYFSIPISDLLSKPTIIELAAVENQDEKALIIALLLLSILSYVNANYLGDSGLRNVILLEEAHVLLDSQENAAQSDSNPSQIAKNLVKRMLAELRSYGIGLIIADQSPRKVTADVVALTDVKLAFRLVEGTDKQMLADSINMSEQQERRLSRLKPGEAFFFFNKLEEPEEVLTENYRLEHKIDITISDSEIAKLTTYWKHRAEHLRPYPECRIIASCQECCDYDRRILAKEIARRILAKYFNKKSDITTLEDVFKKIVSISKQELGDEPLTPELFSCIKMHLFRRIRYETNIHITDAMIRNSLRRDTKK